MKTRDSFRKTRGPRDPRAERESDGATRYGAGAPKEWLDSFLLLCLREEGAYSHRLEEKLGELGFGELCSGEMYRSLWRMERKGLIHCDRRGGGFKLPRRWYEITGLGEAYLELFVSSFERNWEEMDELHGGGLGVTALPTASRREGRTRCSWWTRVLPTAPSP